MVEWAKKYVGIPYSLGHRTIKGCDCYGLVHIIYKNELNITLPTYSDEYDGLSDSEKLLDVYKKHRNNWTEVHPPKIGDVVYFTVAGFAKHVGVMISDKHFLHNLKNSSTISSVDNMRWCNRIIGFYRYE